MSYQKYIRTHYWGNNYSAGNAFIISQDYERTLTAYQAMLAEARKSFPSLTASDVRCTTVTGDGWVKERAVLRFQCDPHETREGWTNCEKLPGIEVRG